MNWLLPSYLTPYTVSLVLRLRERVCFISNMHCVKPCTFVIFSVAFLCLSFEPEVMFIVDSLHLSVG